MRRKYVGLLPINNNLFTSFKLHKPQYIKSIKIHLGLDQVPDCALIQVMSCFYVEIGD